MAEDDLDAFFDEVEEAEEEAKKLVEEEKNDAHSKVEAANLRVNEVDNKDDCEQPPSKKSKITADTNHVVTVVAASAAPTININPKVISNTQQNRSKISSNVNVSSSYKSQTLSSAVATKNIETQKASKSVTKRTAAGKVWEDPTLIQWPKDDFRLFIGNLAKDVHTTQLEEVFRNKYASFAMGRVIYNKADNKSKGYGFVSLLDPRDAAKALREMNDFFLGNRPIKVKRGEWQDRDLRHVQKKKKQQKKMKKQLGIRR